MDRFQWIIIVMIAIVALIYIEIPSTILNRVTVTEIDENDKLEISSSVWCTFQKKRGSDVDNRICHFRNLCYRPDLNEYLFFHGRVTIISGIDWTSSSVVSMSSVSGLNVHHMTLTDLPSIAALKLYPNIEWLDLDSCRTIHLLMKRFKPDNLMHVLHDDLLPIFATVFTQSVEDKVKLVMLDGHDEHQQYFPLYQMLFNSPSLLSKHFKMDGQMTYCFQSALVGLSKDTLWYDYGFDRPQGPTGNNVSKTIVNNFIDHVLKRLNINCNCQASESYVVLVLRQTNRLIVNPAQVIEAIVSTTGLRVVILNPDDHQLSNANIIQLVMCSKLLVGMHGATLALALFLRPGSALIELFPYHVPSKDYTPFRTLVDIVKTQVKYAAWENRYRENTVTHPDWPPEIGGLIHLTKKQRLSIESSKTPIKTHRCCSHPEWLFHIYQDTIVDISSFVQVLKEIMSTLLTHTGGFTNNIIHPGPVRNLNCHLINKQEQNQLKITWISPWNLKFISQQTQPRCDRVDITIQRIDDDHIYFSSFFPDDNDNVIYAHIVNFTRTSKEVPNKYNCWVTCTLDNLTGQTKWTQCK